MGRLLREIRSRTEDVNQEATLSGFEKVCNREAKRIEREFRLKPKFFLADSNPELAEEFDQASNNGISFDSIGRGSDKKFNWRCSRGHSWLATASSRAAGRGCPFCAGKRREAGKNSLAETHPELFRELHATRNSDMDTATLAPNSHAVLFWQCQTNPHHVYDMSIAKRTGRGQGCPFCSNKRVLIGENDLESQFPKIADEWHYEKNHGITPREIVYGSQKVVWWRCRDGHEFQTRISHRTKRAVGCPYCSGRRVTDGATDIASTNPEYLEFWDFELNSPLEPKNVSSGSDKEVWWTCKEGHLFKKTVYSFVRQGKGCPTCTGKTVLPGFNDILSDPMLANEVDVLSNQKANIELDEVHRGSHTKIWWKCSEGHSWSASPDKRRKGRGCPNCSAGGFDSTTDGYIYYLSHPELGAKKVGITNFSSPRLDSFMQLGWLLIWKSDLLPGSQCRKVELSFFRWLRKDLQMPPFLGSKEMGRVGGFSETFSAEVDDKEVLGRLSELLRKLD